LEYIGRDNAPHEPIVIHRTVLGSMERFIGGLIEHYGGAFPLWLAPVQMTVVTISDKSSEYAQRVRQFLRAAGFRAEVDVSSDKIGPKKHRARAQKIPYILVVGEQEAKEETVNVNDRDGRSLGNFALEQFMAGCAEEIAKRSLKSD
jgi:threonyl-tRNA synthetase